MEKQHTVIARFNFKTKEACEDSVEFMQSENGLTFSRAQPGAILLELYVVNDTDVVIWEKWTSKEAYEAYLQLRKDSGIFEKLTFQFHKNLEDADKLFWSGKKLKSTIIKKVFFFF